MITSYIQGGLGNQMFQIAAGYSLSLDLNVPFILYEGQHYLPLQGNNISTYKDNILRNVKFGNFSYTNIKSYQEPRFSYIPIPKIDNICLAGYFQSEKYFKSHEKDIRDLFIVEKSNLIPKDEISVSIHIRRGDYKKFPEIHIAQDKKYYMDSLEEIGKVDKVYVFSDELISEDFLPVKFTQIVSSDIEEFYAMSSCNHNIICNSSFSWWAAYLNNNKNKIVVAPMIWFGPKGYQDWQDIYCEGWKIV